jgi:hypothetical protein
MMGESIPFTSALCSIDWLCEKERKREIGDYFYENGLSSPIIRIVFIHGRGQNDMNLK